MMKNDADTPSVPIDVLLRRLESDNSLNWSVRCSEKHNYDRTLSHANIGRVTTVFLFAAAGAASSFADRPVLTSAFLAAGAIAGGYTFFVHRVNAEVVAWLREKYDTPSSPTFE